MKLKNLPGYIASYFKLQDVDAFSSAYHQELSVKYTQGRYILNGQRVNYAFGGLHDFFVKAFGYLNIPYSHTKQVLILGFGVGDVAHILINKKADLEITGVELDPAMYDIAYKYFQLDQIAHQTTLYWQDVYEFAQTTDQTFDLIVLDVFEEDEVPEQLYDKPFLKNLKKMVNKKGTVFFNHLGDRKALKKKSQTLQKMLEKTVGPTFPLTISGNRPLIVHTK